MLTSRSIRFRLLLAVNAAMVIPLSVFLIVDYLREVEKGVEQRHLAMEEEAKTLLPGVLRVRPQGIEAVQEYVDSVCGAMRESQSPGHHIAVRLGRSRLQALAHQRASREMLQAMERGAVSASHRAVLGNEELVVGTDSRADVTVYVSEYLSDIRRSVHRQILIRIVRIGVLLLVAAIAVNVVFHWMAARPLKKLVDTVRRIGEGELGALAEGCNAEEFIYLAEAINTMSRSLAQTDRSRQLEMGRARRIQEQLLPKNIEVPGVRVACLYQPAEEVAGDYYDVIRLSSGTCVVCVADVSGHGVPAALSATMLKALLLHATDHHQEPGQMLAFVNERLTTVYQTENIASMFLACFDAKEMALQYASAGHETGLLLAATAAPRELASTGLLLGVMEEAAWETWTLGISPGDRLLVVTDGVTEALSDKEGLFGRDRLTYSFGQSRDVPLSEAVRRIDQALKAHRGSRPASDDTTVVAIEFI